MATNDAILKEVREHTEILRRLEQAESARIEREKAIADKLASHEAKIGMTDKIIFGNGTAGLKTEVKLLNEAMGRVNWVGAAFTIAVIADIASRVLAK